MNFNPFEHFTELVFTNTFGGTIFGLPWQPTVTLPDGSIVPSAAKGEPETHYLFNGAGFEAVTDAQAAVQHLWLNYSYGAGLPDAVALTPADLIAAVRNMPNFVDDALAGFTDVEIIGYVSAVAPDWMV